MQFVGHLLGGSIVGLTMTSSKRTYATCHTSEDYSCQSPVPRARHRWPMLPKETLKHSKTGLAQSTVGVTVCFTGSLCTHGFVCVLGATLAGMRFDSKCDCTPPTVLLWLFLYPWTWVIVSWWIPTLPVHDCSALNWDFSVVSREDEQRSFYSTILKVMEFQLSYFKS